MEYSAVHMNFVWHAQLLGKCIVFIWLTEFALKMFMIPGQQFIAVRNRNHNIYHRRGANIRRKPAETEESMESRFRLSEDNLNHLANEYDNWRDQVQNRTNIATSYRRITVFCYYLAGGGYLRQTAFPYGVATSTAHMYLYDVANFLCSVANRHINFPGMNELPNNSEEITMVNGQRKRVILYIDGMIVRIQRPSNAGDAYYCGRPGKNCPCFSIFYPFS